MEVGDEFGANKPWIGELNSLSPKINITKEMGNLQKKT